MKYQVIHKLNKRPVRSAQTLEILLFDTKESAQAVVDLKNKIMGADFYLVVEVK